MGAGAFFAQAAAAFITLDSEAAVGGAEALTVRGAGVWSGGVLGFALPLERGRGECRGCTSNAVSFFGGIIDSVR